MGFRQPDPSLSLVRSSFILPPDWYPPRHWNYRPVRPPRLWCLENWRPQLERLQIPVSDHDVESRSRKPRRITEFGEPDEVHSEEPTPVEEADTFDA